MRLPAAKQTLLQQLGLWRSLIIYHGNPRKTRRMTRFYTQFLGEGDLAFDIGAHVGDRIRVWTNLGVRTVAVEPQPLCMGYLRSRFGQNKSVTLIEAALGAQHGSARLLISARTPTVSTLSREWAEEVNQAESFASVQWETAAPVSVTTLDTLIDRYGLPAFCKIDVEGYELEVLRGLTHPIWALSFEFIPATHHLSLGCVEQIETLTGYEYNWSLGERHRWESEVWLPPDTMITQLKQFPLNGASGDIYARRKAERAKHGS